VRIQAFLAPSDQKVMSVQPFAHVVEGTKISRKCVAITVGALVIIVAAITSVLLLTREDAETTLVITDPPTVLNETFTPTLGGTTPNPTFPPTPESFYLVLDEIDRRFPTLSEQAHVQSTPQFKAALLKARRFIELRLFRQQYALVTFYYSTGGDVWWNRQCNFLTTWDICQWNCAWDANAEDYPTLAPIMGVYCTGTGDATVYTLELGNFHCGCVCMWNEGISSANTSL
jgi:hypothetical protein